MTHEHDHDTVVVDRRAGGSNMGMILGIIAIVVLLVAVWYFALGPGSGPSTTTNNNNTTINPPAASQPAAPAGSTIPQSLTARAGSGPRSRRTRLSGHHQSSRLTEVWRGYPTTRPRRG